MNTKRSLVVSIVLMLIGVSICAAEGNIPHPWWNLSATQIKQYFDRGIASKNMGYDSLSLSFKITPRVQIGDSGITLINVSIDTPPNTLAGAGWVMEHEKKSESEKAEFLNVAIKRKYTTVDFSVYLTSKSNLDDLYNVTYALETDKGVILKRISPAETPSTSVGSTDVSSWFNFHSYPRFSITDDKGNIEVTPSTKWLKLWIISSSRTSVTYWIDGSNKTEVRAEN
ncbi:MAG: hypothetical protein ABFD64_00055 [Armatimonadota bacterium]